jgi:hypothetical protein
VILESALADALYLNWAIPAAALPPLPSTAASLRYDLAPLDDRSSAGFFSLVLFRQVGVHLRGADWLALSYPQANARLYVRDASGVASVFLLRQLAPAWVVPIARAVARQPLSAAILDFPRGPAAGLDGPRRWKVQAGAGFEAEARVGAPPAARPPKLGEWSEQALFFRERPRTYWSRGATLRRTETEHPAAEVLPMRVELGRTDWLETFLPFAPAGSWADLHSAFLVPEVRLAFLFGAQPELAVPAQVAAAG